MANVPVDLIHFELVIDALKNGISVMQLVATMRKADATFPSASQLYDYCNSDSERKERYIYAREQCTHAMADQIVEIADTVADPQRARNMINARQWVASKINAKNYGDKMDLTVDNKIDITVAVTGARNRLEKMRNALEPLTIEGSAQPVDVDPFS